MKALFVFYVRIAPPVQEAHVLSRIEGKIQQVHHIGTLRLAEH